jgi:hypothetical protein
MTATVQAQLAYLVSLDARAAHLVYPLSSGRKIVRPEQAYHTLPITDCRELPLPATVDGAGFELLREPSAMQDFYDDAAVRDATDQGVKDRIELLR